MLRYISTASLLLALVVHLVAVDTPTTAASLVGKWTADPEATWDKMKNNAELVKETATLTPEQRTQWKNMFTKQMESMTCEITKDKVIVDVGGETQESSYTIIRTDGNALIIEAVSTDGRPKHVTRMEVVGNILRETYLAEPGVDDDGGDILERGEDG
jgi:hypothetical protein